MSWSIFSFVLCHFCSNLCRTCLVPWRSSLCWEHVGLTVIVFIRFGACFSTSDDSSLLYAVTSSSALLKHNESLRAFELCMSLLKESKSIERSFLKETAILSKHMLWIWLPNDHVMPYQVRVPPDMCWFIDMVLHSTRLQNAVKLNCIFVCYLVKMKNYITSNNDVFIYGDQIWNKFWPLLF